MRDETNRRVDEIRRFGGFAVAGGLAALVNLVSRYAISQVTIYELAVALAYLVGMTTAFVLARQWVFQASGRRWTDEYLRFSAVNAVAFLQVWLVSVGLVRLVFPAIGFHWHPEEIGHLIGVASPIVTSYYLHKHFSFKAAGTGQQRDDK